MSSSATGVGMTICFLGAILLILTQKSSQKFGDVLGIMIHQFINKNKKTSPFPFYCLWFALSLHKIGFGSAIRVKLYCVHLALSLHKIDSI